jgi:hypothetical protein
MNGVHLISNVTFDGQEHTDMGAEDETGWRFRVT